MEKQLSELQCHFNWYLMEDLDKVKWKPKFSLEPQGRVDFLKKDIIANPKIEMEARLFISFLLMQLDIPNHVEAINEIEFVIEKNRQSKIVEVGQYMAYLYISLANKAYILQQLGRTKEVENVLREIEELGDNVQTGQAYIYGVHGYACSMMGDSKYEEGLELYKKARELDSKTYTWPMCIGILAGRLRRVEEGYHSCPTAMEEESFQEAIKLSNKQEPLPLLFMAQTYMCQGPTVPTNASEYSENRAFQTAEFLFRKAYEVAPKNLNVLVQCGKSFRLLGDVKFAEQCLREALEIDPNNPMTLRDLGLLYEFQKKDYITAKSYFTEAMSKWESHDYGAALDMIRIRIRLQEKFDEFGEYAALLEKYKNDERVLEKICFVIKKRKDFLSNLKTPTNKTSSTGLRRQLPPRTSDGRDRNQENSDSYRNTAPVNKSSPLSWRKKVQQRPLPETPNKTEQRYLTLDSGQGDRRYVHPNGRPSKPSHEQVNRQIENKTDSTDNSSPPLLEGPKRIQIRSYTRC